MLMVNNPHIIANTEKKQILHFEVFEVRISQFEKKSREGVGR